MPVHWGMPRPPLPFRLRAQDRRALEALLRGGVQQVRVVVRAMALLRLDRGDSAPQVAEVVRLTPHAVRKIAQRYRAGGMARAVFEAPRPGAAEVLAPSDKQRIIAMVCSAPPPGAARWTVRLVAEQAVTRKVVPRVGRETIRVLLQSHDLKPWREKNVVRG
jgi:putative transposase